MNYARNTVAAFALGTMLGAPLGIVSAKSSDHRTFSGTIVHISGENIKVKGMEGGKEQTLSFLYLPRIHKVLHSNGKTTAAQAKLHVGEYVRVQFDQKLLGVRHADAVYPEAKGSPIKM